MKLWNGRFKKEMDMDCSKFLASIALDIRLAKYDIWGSVAHVRMLGKCGIIKKDETKKIIAGLEEILLEIENKKLSFSDRDEDIHMLIEKKLIEKIGNVGGKLHTARSRNDQVSLDVRMYLRHEMGEILNLIVKFQKVIVKIAQKNIDVIMPGFTHLQHAQPILFAHHILAYWWMLERDKERLLDCLKRVNVMPLGVGALAGTSFPIDRSYVARLLKFPQVSQNSIDTVGDRDFIIEFLSDAATLMMHLSRFSEEIILWNSVEFSFIEIDDAFSTGSSIMPQKKNPDIAELIRGKTGKIYGALIALFTQMKSLPLAYNRDMQEDKEELFKTIDTLKEVLIVFPKMLSSILIKKKRMYTACQEGFLNATNVAEYLTNKGIPFREAHRITGKIVAYCIEKEKRLENLSVGEFCTFSGHFKDDIKDVIRLENCVNSRNSFAGTALSCVKKQIKRIKELMAGKKLQHFCLFLFFLFFFSGKIFSADEFSERKLTLRQGIRLALLNSQTLLSKHRDVSIAKEKVKEARSFMYPQLDLNCNISRLKTVSALSLPPELGGIWLEPNEEGNFYAMQLSLYQYIYQGSWFRGDTKKLADINLKGENSAYEQLKSEIKQEVKKVFYQLLLLHKKIEIYEKTIQEFEEKFTQKEYSSSYSKMKQQKILAIFKSNLRKCEKDISLARLNFNSILGIELNTSVKLIGKLEFKDLEVDLNKYIAWAFQYRPELLQTRAQEEMNALAVSLSLKERYPTIVMGANYQYGGRDLPMDEKNWIASINLKIPIFDAWAGWARVKQKKANLEKARFQKAAVEDKVRWEVNKKYLEFIAVQKQVREMKIDWETARNIRTKAEKEKISYFELMEIYDFYIKMRLEYIQSIYKHIIARADLEKAIGVDIVEK